MDVTLHVTLLSQDYRFGTKVVAKVIRAYYARITI